MHADVVVCIRLSFSPLKKRSIFQRETSLKKHMLFLLYSSSNRKLITATDLIPTCNSLILPSKSHEEIHSSPQPGNVFTKAVGRKSTICFFSDTPTHERLRYVLRNVLQRTSLSQFGECLQTRCLCCKVSYVWFETAACVCGVGVNHRCHEESMLPRKDRQEEGNKKLWQTRTLSKGKC